MQDRTASASTASALASSPRPCRNGSSYGVRGSGHDLQEVFDGYVAKTPLGRIETPTTSRVVLYLASPASEFLTGAAIDITGGAHLT